MICFIKERNYYLSDKKKEKKKEILKFTGSVKGYCTNSTHNLLSYFHFGFTIFPYVDLPHTIGKSISNLKVILLPKVDSINCSMV